MQCLFKLANKIKPREYFRIRTQQFSLYFCEQQFQKDGKLETDQFVETKQSLTSSSEAYQSLKTEADALLTKLDQVHRAYSEFTEISSQLTSWADSVDVDGYSSPDGMDMASLQDELTRATSLTAQASLQAQSLEKLRAALQTLRVAGSGDESLQVVVDKVAGEIARISDAANTRCSGLQTAIVQSQGVQDGIDGLLSWAKSAETAVAALSRPIPLDRDALASRLQDVTALMADIDSHANSIDAMKKAVSESQSDPASEAAISGKLNDLNAQFDKVKSDCSSHQAQFSGLNSKLTKLNEALGQYDDWVSSAFDILDSNDAPSEEGRQRLVDDVEKHRADLDAIHRLADEVINSPNVGDASRIRDAVAGADRGLEDLSEVVASQERQGALRDMRSNQFADSLGSTVKWLQTKEERVEAMEPVAVSLSSVDQQIEELAVSIHFLLTTW